MNLNENKIYIKIVSLDAIYNFPIEKFLNQNCLESQNLILIFKFQNL